MTYKAKCGHEDPLGYFTGTPCGACVRKAHREAIGEALSPLRPKKKKGN